MEAVGYGHLPFGLVDADTLHTELTRVREQGYAVDNAEHENGLYCIGAAIYNHRGDVSVLAVSRGRSRDTGKGGCRICQLV